MWLDYSPGVSVNVAELFTWRAESVVFFAGKEQEKGGYPVLAQTRHAG